jgi:small subunit ribosomal protein S3
LSKWYADKKNFPILLMEDVRIRQMLKERLSSAAVSRIIIERPSKTFKITLVSAKPGVVIGKKGEEIEKIKADIQKIVSVPVHVVVEESKKPDADAQYVSDFIAQQLQKRVQFRRALKRSMQAATKAGVLGVKMRVSGRLNGIDIARSEWYREGRVPLHTINANIDFGFSEAQTTYGIIGVKVWFYKGDIV